VYDAHLNKTLSAKSKQLNAYSVTLQQGTSANGTIHIDLDRNWNVAATIDGKNITDWTYFTRRSSPS
jgi:hypothetical protein